MILVTTCTFIPLLFGGVGGFPGLNTFSSSLEVYSGQVTEKGVGKEIEMGVGFGVGVREKYM